MFFNALDFFNRKNRLYLDFLSEKLDLENTYEPHIDIYYKSLLF